MGLVARARSAIRGWTEGEQRAGAPPIDWYPGTQRWFGPGLGNQPSHETLLREVLLIADACTRVTANRLATIRMQVVRDVQDGRLQTTEVVEGHPLGALLARPHPQISSYQLMRLTGQWILTTGEAYWQKIGSGMGVPVELHPAVPDRIEPLVTGGGISQYRITEGDGTQRDMPADIFVRYWFPDPENLFGSEGTFAPQAAVADAYKFAAETGRAHYQHDATPKQVQTNAPVKDHTG